MDLKAVVERVRAEFSEMPGLRLTQAQACRLLGLDDQSCREVLEVLVAADFLRKTHGGMIARVDS